MLCHMARKPGSGAQKRAHGPAVHRQYEIIVLRRERLEQRGECSGHDVRYGLIRVSGDHRRPENHVERVEVGGWSGGSLVSPS
jgi:hypothetical protein